MEQEKATEVKECRKCQKKGLANHQWIMVILSFYILFAAIYGTVKLFSLLLSNF
jgi:hypothetical protein